MSHRLRTKNASKSIEARGGHKRDLLTGTFQFPYAINALPGVLKYKWDDPDFAQYRDAFPAEYRSSPEALETHVRDLTKRDVKIAYLKNLQGMIS